jgi:hypothetical protein
MCHCCGVVVLPLPPPPMVAAAVTTAAAAARVLLRCCYCARCCRCCCCCCLFSVLRDVGDVSADFTKVFFRKISVRSQIQICDRQITKCDHKSQNHRSQNFVSQKKLRSGNLVFWNQFLDVRESSQFFGLLQPQLALLMSYLHTFYVSVPNLTRS